MGTTIGTDLITNHPGSSARARPLRPVARAMAVVLLVTMALVSVGTTGAEALTTVRQGSHGGFAFQQVGGQTVHGSWGSTPGLRITGPWVSRSTASASTQTVWFQAFVEQRYPDGRWVTVWNSGMRGTTLAPGQARYLTDLYAPVGRGTFRVTEYLYWRDAWNRNLGAAGASYDASGDYYCRIATCSIGRGFIRL